MLLMITGIKPCGIWWKKGMGKAMARVQLRVRDAIAPYEKTIDGVRSMATRQPYIQIYQAIASSDVADFQRKARNWLSYQMCKKGGTHPIIELSPMECQNFSTGHFC